MDYMSALLPLLAMNVVLIIWNAALCGQNARLQKELLKRKHWHEREIQRWRQRL